MENRQASRKTQENTPDKKTSEDFAFYINITSTALDIFRAPIWKFLYLAMRNCELVNEIFNQPRGAVITAKLQGQK